MNQISPEVRKEVQANKRIMLKLVLIGWPLLMLLGAIIFVYVPSNVVEMIFIKADKAQVLEMQKQLDKANNEIKDLNAEVDRQKEQVSYYKLKADRPTYIDSGDGIQFKIPNIETKYMSWTDYHKKYSTKNFADFRNDEAKFLREQLAKADEFLNTIKAR